MSEIGELFESRKKTHQFSCNGLTQAEIDVLTKKEFAIERLAVVRDLFVFSCYTDLAYADIKKLKRSEIAPGLDGEKWIFTSRQKTDTSSRIPLLPQAMMIIERYANDLV